VTDRVAVYSHSIEFLNVVQLYFELQGFSVMARQQFPGNLQQLSGVLTVFMDCQFLEPEQIGSLQMQARMVGAELVLCEHWSRAAHLKRCAGGRRVSVLEYPLHPRELQKFTRVNRFIGVASNDFRRQFLVDVAGLIYKIEGVAVETLEHLSALLIQRMAELMVFNLEAYGRILASDRREISTLAQALSPQGRSLFRPYLTYSTIKAYIMPQIGPATKILCCGPHSSDIAFTLGILLESQDLSQRPEIYALIDDMIEGPIEYQVEASDFQFTPYEFRALIQSLLREGEGGAPSLTKEAASYFTTVKQSELDDSGAFDLIVVERIDEIFDGDLESALNKFVNSLSENGTLLLGPGESILFNDFPLIASKIGSLNAYQHRSFGGKGLVM
jgi:chemotaxis methyl-accepting protein methylase